MRGGHQPALSEKDLPQDGALFEDPAITVERVARRLGVGAWTLCRHLPGGRIGVERVRPAKRGAYPTINAGHDSLLNHLVLFLDVGEDGVGFWNFFWGGWP